MTEVAPPLVDGHAAGTGVPAGAAPGSIDHWSSCADFIATGTHTLPSASAFCAGAWPVSASATW